MKFKTRKDERLPVVPSSSDMQRRQFDEALRDKIEQNFKDTRGDLDLLKYKRNLIKNGSFEIWTAVAGSAPDAWAKIGTPTVTNDNYSLKVTSGGANNEGCKQTFYNLLASQKYTVIAYMRATSGDTAKIWTTGGDINVLETTTETTWQRVEAIFQTDSSATNVVLNCGSAVSGDIVWFDDIEVYEYN